MEDKTLCEYETVGIHTIRPHPRNPRKGDVDLIEESINENGFFDPIGVQKSTGFIIDGNHRWKAAKKLGMETVPVVWLDVDDTRAMKIMLVANKSNDLASYDDDLLNEMLSELNETGDLVGSGYDIDDLIDNSTSVSGGSLSERFMLPPFTVLNAREGWWQERKKAWLSLGIESELGRGGGGSSPGQQIRSDRQAP